MTVRCFHLSVHQLELTAPFLLSFYKPHVELPWKLMGLTVSVLEVRTSACVCGAFVNLCCR